MERPCKPAAFAGLSVFKRYDDISEHTMTGTLVNAAAIIAGGLIGLCLQKGIQARYKTTIMQAISLTVVLIGIRSALNATDLLEVIVCMALGSLMGEAMGIEDRIEALGSLVEKRYSRSSNGGFAKGLVTASLVFCVGSMAIVGSLESGLTGSHETLFAKSLLDGITSVVFASTFGGGVIFSAVPVLLYQGSITLGASMLKPFLTGDVIAQMSGVGGLLIAAIGINMLEVARIRIGNMLPAIFLPLVYFMVVRLF
ncbi:DUF554 domain-containing protein [uncultured Desulfosarcina sp.]|uniref:DUF554 domain-containing protein n=1 Tax=uncultured Desulfosarcina sp. TaxID=218289 RepID=UPI0029C87CD1|nr:DUF554 domain-containing protein [uncultured Desulfosarcina sp.]